MSHAAKREYLMVIHARYQQAARPEKTRILDEFCQVTGYHRKSALRLLNGAPPGRRPQRLELPARLRQPSLRRRRPRRIRALGQPSPRPHRGRWDRPRRRALFLPGRLLLPVALRLSRPMFRFRISTNGRRPRRAIGRSSWPVWTRQAGGASWSFTDCRSPTSNFPIRRGNWRRRRKTLRPSCR